MSNASSNISSNVSSMDRYRKKRRRTGSIRWFLLLLFLLACIFAGYFFSQSAFFNISHISVTGNKVLTTEEIVSHSGLKTGEHIYKANMTLAQNLISTDPWVDTVAVRRRLPSTVVIEVKERVAIAVVPVEGGVLQVDAKGFVLKRQKLLEGLALMTIGGVADIPDNILPGQQINSAALTKGLSVVSHMTKDAAGVISEVDVTNTQQIILQNIYGIEWRIGDGSNFMTKFNICNQITADEEAAGRLGKIIYIDTSLMDKPTILYRK